MNKFLTKTAFFGLLALGLFSNRVHAQGMPDSVSSLTIHSDSFEGTTSRLPSNPKVLDLNEQFAQAAGKLKKSDSHCFEFTKGILSRINTSKPIQSLRGQNWTIAAKVSQESKPESCDFSLDFKTTNTPASEGFTVTARSNDELSAHYAMKTLDFLINRALEARKLGPKAVSTEEKIHNQNAARDIFVFRDYLRY